MENSRRHWIDYGELQERMTPSVSIRNAGRIASRGAFRVRTRPVLTVLRIFPKPLVDNSASGSRNWD
jgi:hypothetical protein